ncbi:MAG: hypothetical protein PF637_05655 [Spirochaetes bacterium]|jgi:hypothetical protein|nr:hypothetical protein [Spirochaetota bacterium]
MRKHSKISCYYLILFLLVSCKTVPLKQQTDYINYEDGKSRYSVESEYLSCLEVNANKKDDYIFFELVSKSNEKLDKAVKQADKDLKTALVYRLKSIFQKKLKIRVYEVWDMNRITLPATYRHFYKKTPDGYEIKSVAVFLRKDAEPLALLKYMPLEYKLPFLKEMEIEYRKIYN